MSAHTLPHYDPNIRWATHTFEITYQQWDYKASFRVEVGGNCKGFDLFDAAIDEHADQLFKAQGENPELLLVRLPNDEDCEDTLECRPDGDDLDRWLKRMCVGIQIIGHVEEQRT